MPGAGKHKLHKTQKAKQSTNHKLPKVQTSAYVFFKAEWRGRFILEKNKKNQKRVFLAVN